MTTIRSYRDLEVWHAAMDLAVSCYQATARLPDRERFGLAAQMRRAAVSVVSNIAEGHSRRSRAAYAHHLSIALGPHAELETQVELARRLSLLKTEEAKGLDTLAARTGQMLSALYRAVARRQPLRAPSPEPRVPPT